MNTFVIMNMQIRLSQKHMLKEMDSHECRND